MQGIPDTGSHDHARGLAGRDAFPHPLQSPGLSGPQGGHLPPLKGNDLTNFSSLELHGSLIKALEAQGITEPTPIQTQAIPHILGGRDLMGLAQTGTGKTAAFGLPLVHLLMGRGKAAPKAPRALILAPTRELVNQIADNLGKLTADMPISVATVVGGASINNQVRRLSKPTDILVATPGRLIDLLERRALTLADAGRLVLDEADQMLDMGFIQALRRIARHLPAERQTTVFSATMPKAMAELAGTYLRDPVRVEATPPGRTADKVEQSVHFTTQSDKARLLESYLGEHRGELALVFTRTKHGAEKLMKLLAGWGFEAASIHGNKSQGQRERALKAFRDGKVQVLVATDVAARGLDIPAVRHVYNHDLPEVPEAYIHRIGRTARAGAEGNAVAFCAPAEIGSLRDIEKILGRPIAVGGGTAPAPAAAAPRGKPRRPQNRSQRGRRAAA